MNNGDQAAEIERLKIAILFVQDGLLRAQTDIASALGVIADEIKRGALPVIPHGGGDCP